MPPLYVIGKNKEKNQLIVGEREECYRNKFQIINSQIAPMAGDKLWVRIRNLGELYEVEEFDGKTVVTKEAIFSPAPGQSAVFYDQGGMVVGGGVIG